MTKCERTRLNPNPTSLTMKNDTPTTTKPPRTLSALHEVELLPPFRGIYEMVTPGAGGPEPWRRRKLAAAHELLALTQVSGRMTIQYLDLAGPFRAVFTLRVPVPCREGGVGPFRVAPAAVVGLTYRQEAVLTAQPGYSFAEVLQPRDVFHPNVAPSYQPPGAQVICLGKL